MNVMARKIPFRARRNRLPKESRTILLFDETDTDNGMFYRCWNCGYICHDKRDSLGGSNSGDAISHTDFSIPATPLNAGDKPYAIVIDVRKTIVSPALDSSGNPKATVHSHRAVVEGGCPFCGTLNWRGDYP